MALVKFPLKMADGFNANTLEQLKEHFDIKSVVGYFYDRRLIRWLKINGCAEELSAVEKLSRLDRHLGQKLGEIFGVDGGPEPTLPAWIVEIMNRLKQYTDDKELLAQVEKELLESTAHVAFSQEELDERVTKFGKIYLVSSRFVIPLNATDKTYVGIGESARAVIKSDKIVDFDALNITFEKIRFDDDYQKLIEQSPEKKSEDAKKLYEEGNQAADKDDWSTALEKFKQAAELGYPKAFASVGNIYYLGKGDIEQELDEAQRWYKRGMEKNIGEAFGWYARLLNSDDASEADKREAFNAMKRATELAPENGGWWDDLGNMYRNGIGTEKNPALAFKYYKQAAEAGNVDAMLWTGLRYYNGEGTSKDFTQAFKWCKQAAEAGQVNAMNWTGLLYRNGEGTEKNIPKALEWFEKSAEGGNNYAMVNIAYIYDNGNGVPVDYRKAFEWYKQAAEAGNVTAMFNLGYAYGNGLGVPVDYRKAFEWYKQAAEAGQVNAMNNLGYAYKKGLGVAVDYGQAVYW